MSGYEPMPGHYVRLTNIREGEVLSVGNGFARIRATDGKSDGNNGQPFVAKLDVCDWERLRGPMPDWQPGDVVAVNNGFRDTIMARRDDGTWTCNAVDCPDTDRHDDGYLSRDWDLGDVRVLVRDGEPVTS